MGGVCGDVFEEVEERFAHPSVRVHHERDEFLMHRRCLVLVVLLSLAFHDGIAVGSRVALAGSWLARVVDCRVHDVGDGDVCEDRDAGVSQAIDSDVWSQAVGVAVPVRGAWYLADGLGERGQAALPADRLVGVTLVRFVLVASCVAGVDADQVVGVAGFEGRVWRVAACAALVVVRVGKAGHGEIEFLSNAFLRCEAIWSRGSKGKRGAMS